MAASKRRVETVVCRFRLDPDDLRVLKAAAALAGVAEGRTVTVASRVREAVRRAADEARRNLAGRV